MEETKPYGPLWARIAALFAFLGVCYIISRTHDAYAAIPFYSFLGYWVLLFVSNSRKVSITPFEIRVNYGPLPTGWPNLVLSRPQIKACAFEYHNAAKDTGLKYHHYASVESNAAKWSRVLGPFGTQPEARAAAQKMASVLNQSQANSFSPPLMVIDLGYRPPPRNIRAVVLLAFWGLFCILSLVASVWLTIHP